MDIDNNNNDHLAINMFINCITFVNLISVEANNHEKKNEVGK